MVHIYGIKNCGTIKKTLEWFEKEGLEYTFHNYKKEAATEEKITAWIQKVSWETLLNKRGTTWRKLSEEEKEEVTDADAAISVMLSNNSIIKRPVIEWDDKVIVGFNEENLNDQITRS
ncbi:MAG TPA: ArsC family reductase [Sphingobacterium sp.]|nr:ArsC family reductase [Sphingobacterium sp.]